MKIRCDLPLNPDLYPSISEVIKHGTPCQLLIIINEFLFSLYLQLYLLCYINYIYMHIKADLVILLTKQYSHMGQSHVDMRLAELSSPCSTGLSLKCQWFIDRKSHYSEINQKKKDKILHACPKGSSRPTSQTSKSRLQKDIFIFMVLRCII